MSVKVLIVHAEGEDDLAEKLAGPIRDAGYEPVHHGTILVGDSFTEEASNLLAANGPLVLCGTIKAVGTGLPYRLISAARGQKGKVHIFPVRMDVNAYLEVLAQDAKIAEYAQNPAQAIADLLEALRTRCPPDTDTRLIQQQYDLESRYRELALKACDIIDLVNLPEDDRHLASKELKLRGLYVALRMRLEVQAGDEVDDKTLEALERRRAPVWGGGVRRGGDEEKLVSLGERLAAVRQLVVLGDPGAGKSTLLRWLATAYLLRLQEAPDWRDLPDVASLPDNDWLPILIRCRDLPPETNTLDAMLQHSLRKSELPEEQCEPLRRLLRTKLERGEALLLVDGLDEITDPGARARFAAQIEQIHRAFPNAPLVATSRIVGYREMGYRIRSGFEHLTVADLSKEDKDEFARRWCALTERPERRDEAAADLIHDIHSSDRIERLTGNPMLLTTMALIKRKIGRLPQRRVDLYEKAVEVLLNWRSAVDVALDPREALPQLEYLAHAMCADGIQQVREDQTLELLRQCRIDYPQIHPLQQHSPEEFLALLERRTGLLIQSGHTRHHGHSVPVYEFRHLTIQEYLAGIALVQGHFRGRDKNQTLAEAIAPLAGQVREVEFGEIGLSETTVVENWREALRLCLAACNDDAVDESLLAILRPLPGETGTARARAVLAALCLGDEPNVSEAIADEVLRALAAETGEDDGMGNNYSSLDEASMELAASRWSVPLGEYLLDEFGLIKGELRNKPGGLYSSVHGAQIPQEVAALRAWLAEKASRLPQCDEREAAGIALTVMELAFRSKDCQVPGMADGLIQRLSGSAAMSHAAAWALGWMNDEQHGKQAWKPKPEHMKRLLAETARPECDSEALFWLSRIFRNLGTQEAVAPLLHHLPASPARTRVSILEALGAIAEPQGLEVARIYLTDSDESMRRTALKALAQTCEDKIDIKLLLEGFEMWLGGLDPQSPITDDRVKEAAKRLKKSQKSIRQRYEKLAERFDLKLTWATDKPDSR
jgi:GTPase SAR1 family protein